MAINTCTFHGEITTYKVSQVPSVMLYLKRINLCGSSLRNIIMVEVQIDTLPFIWQNDIFKEPWPLAFYDSTIFFLILLHMCKTCEKERVCGPTLTPPTDHKGEAETSCLSPALQVHSLYMEQRHIFLSTYMYSKYASIFHSWASPSWCL